MRLLIVTICLILTPGYSLGQSAQIGASASLGTNDLNNASGSFSVSGLDSSSGPISARIELLLEPVDNYLDADGKIAVRNAILTIPRPVLDRVTSLSQLFGALATFNPTALYQLASRFFPGATSMMSSMVSSYLPTMQNAGLSLYRTFGSLSSSPLTSFFRQNFPANIGVSGSADGSTDASRGMGSYTPSSIFNSLLGQGMSNLAGVTNSLASGEPISAFLSLAGGAGDTANRMGNLAANGMGMASQAATGLAGRLPGSLGQTFSSMISGSPGSMSASGSASVGPLRGSGRGSFSLSSPLGNLIANRPFTSLLTGR